MERLDEMCECDIVICGPRNNVLFDFEKATYTRVDKFYTKDLVFLLTLINDKK